MFYFYISLILILIYLLLNSCKKPQNYPPGPIFLPLIGNLFHYKKKYSVLGYHHRVWENLSKKYGPIVGAKMGRYFVVSVHGSSAIKEVLTREEFDGRPDGFFFRLRSFGQRLGLIFNDGIFWKNQRKFTFYHLRQFGLGNKEMEKIINVECEALIENLKEKTDQLVYMHNIYDIALLNTIWAMLAGQRYDLSDERLKELMKLIHDIFKIMDVSGGLINQIPVIRYIAPKLTGYTLSMEVLEKMWNFLRETIDEHRNSLNEEPKDLIDAFLHKINQGTENFSYKQLLVVLTDLFMAGVETTSNTLGFAALYMAIYPEIQKKVQKELDEVVGTNSAPTLSDRNKLKYTEAVLLEIQRLASVGALGITHRAKKDTNLMGFIIPKDTLILTNLYCLHRDEKLWKNPHEFQPERFLDASGNISINEDHFMPFGLGRRRCLGEALGKSSTFLFFTSLLHNFFLENIQESPLDPMPNDGVTMSAKPFKVKLISRTGK